MRRPPRRRRRREARATVAAAPAAASAGLRTTRSKRPSRRNRRSSTERPWRPPRRWPHQGRRAGLMRRRPRPFATARPSSRGASPRRRRPLRCRRASPRRRAPWRRGLRRMTAAPARASPRRRRPSAAPWASRGSCNEMRPGLRRPPLTAHPRRGSRRGPSAARCTRHCRLQRRPCRPRASPTCAWRSACGRSTEGRSSASRDRTWSASRRRPQREGTSGCPRSGAASTSTTSTACTARHRRRRRSTSGPGGPWSSAPSPRAATRRSSSMARPVRARPTPCSAQMAISAWFSARLTRSSP
mmetsp:Transcript_19414/g.56385  ORF Transcript_19414/g.56385 Transcript_19414/m.56385 type:complete len:300 (+) Transcript_19414:328-1227(+)